MKHAAAIVVAGLLSVPTFATASVLTFEDLHLYHYGDIPDTYGDNLAGTPNVAVDWYERLIADNSVVHDHLDFWTSGYGDLYEVAYAPTDPDAPGALHTYAEIVLRPDPGYAVRLLSFDMAGYPYADQVGQAVLVNGLNINPSGIIAGNGGHSSFTPNFLSSGPLAIHFGFFNWDVAIDNIAFEQCRIGVDGCRPSVDQVPEPASLALLGAGLLGVALRARARRRA